MIFFSFYFSFSILQVAKTSSVKDVIVQALAKNRKDSESDRKSPEDYVLVEEIDVLDRLVLHAITVYTYLVYVPIYILGRTVIS